MKSLSEQPCQSITKGSPALEQIIIEDFMKHVPGWRNLDNHTITRDFTFSDYYQTMEFVNAVAQIAHQCDHHPDMQVSYNHCKVSYSTHATGGLSINDFICAAKIDRLHDK